MSKNQNYQLEKNGIKIISITHRFLMAFTVLLLICSAGTIFSAAEEEFSALVKRLQKEQPVFAKRQKELLAERYDLDDHDLILQLNLNEGEKKDLVGFMRTL